MEDLVDIDRKRLGRGRDCRYEQEIMENVLEHHFHHTHGIIHGLDQLGPGI